MKYTYVYKTSDGTRHEDSMNADSREAVFAALRERGIKAIKVVAADGSKANGEIRGVRKRVVAALVVLTMLVAGVGAFYVARVGDKRPPAKQLLAVKLPRQAVLGDRKRIDGAAETIFVLKAERFLARFAEPGRPYSAPELDWPSKDDFDAALASPDRYAEADYTEWIDLKRIVAGMKNELRDYLKGGGYVSGYIKDLIERQNIEIGTREQFDKKLKEMLSDGRNASPDHKIRFQTQGACYDYWVKANAHLQSMGIYPLPIPDQLRNIQFMLGGER